MLLAKRTKIVGHQAPNPSDSDQVQSTQNYSNKYIPYSSVYSTEQPEIELEETTVSEFKNTKINTFYFVPFAYS